MIHFIPGGVCAAQGFSASGIHVGVKSKFRRQKGSGPDLF